LPVLRATRAFRYVALFCWRDMAAGAPQPRKARPGAIRYLLYIPD
jgi:hypothetical protein